MELLSSKIDDFELIFGVLVENSEWFNRKGINQWPLNWLESQKESLFNSVSSGNFYYLVFEEEMAAVVELTFQPEAAWGFDDEPALYMHKFAVKRKFSGHGLGHIILHKIIDIAVSKGLNFVRLDCVSHNPLLCAYYEDFGFKCAGELFDGEVDLSLYQYCLQGR